MKGIGPQGLGRSGNNGYSIGSPDSPAKIAPLIAMAGKALMGAMASKVVDKVASPAKIKDAAYEKSNRKMRSKYTKETGKTLGKRHLSGTSPRRVSFACRFAGMKGPMKDSKGEPTRKAMALKKWGFGSVAAASSFCRKHKKS